MRSLPSFLGTNRLGEPLWLPLSYIQQLSMAISNSGSRFASSLGEKWYGG